MLGLVLLGMGPTAPLSEPQADIEVFVRQGCPHCAAAKLFLEDLHRERPELRILVQDVGEDPGAQARLKDLAVRFDVRQVGVPAFYVRGELIIGYASAETTGRRIQALLDARPSRQGSGLPEGACPPEVGEACTREVQGSREEREVIETPFGRLSVQDWGLPLFTLAIGILDGFNPCSMWVLVFMLSLLASLRDRLKMVLIAGTFVAVEGLAYFAFMAAWLNVFLLIGLSRATGVILGGLASLAGVINVKEFWDFRRGISLSIPETAKPGLYTKIRGIVQAENLAGALVGTMVLAVFVQVVELLCTAGFPAVYTRILTMRQLEWWSYYGYLALYNVAYMLDDILVLVIGVVTLSQRRLQEQEGRWLKLVSGLVMLGLGVTLIAAPDWLVW